MKQKHWQVSVFDKTSETIRDDTFYTTDTEAYLVFELIDEDFTPDSAMVTVYNIYGKATINASVEIVDGIVQYEMPEEAIGHPGGWRTQVIITKDSEDYTTRIIEFDVGGHLLDNRKPAIVDIENWNSFIAHAGELIDDWEQLEGIRQTNEQQRELAESARQNEFEANESTRQSEFEENELARESAESVRVANEEERISNESERISKDGERDSKIEAVEDNLESKANKQQEDWIEPTLVNGFTGWAKYRMNQLGSLEIVGEITPPTDAISNLQVFSVTPQYRPTNNYSKVISDNLSHNLTTGEVFIRTNGTVSITVNSNSTYYLNEVLLK